MAIGKNVNSFYMDGDPLGRVKCTIFNWSGIAFKIPKADLEKCRNRSELKESGVYFLLGTDDETGKPVVYVGQAATRKNGEGILGRLFEHKRNPDKDYWNEAVVFTTTNQSLGPTEISYLENRFCNLALEANRYHVMNGNEPPIGSPTEEKISDMEEYIENAKTIMITLGHKVFEPYTESPSPETTSNDIPSQTLYFTREIKKDHFTAKGIAKQTTEGYVVLPGSIIAPNDDDSVSIVIKNKRDNANIYSIHVLHESVLFTSPSGAAMFVAGKSTNGWTAWKTEDGVTLQDLENSEDVEE